MNSMTRMILRRLVSGKVTLTPELLKVLKECERAFPDAKRQPKKTGESTTPLSPPDKTAGKRPEAEKRLTFVNPLPGRWVRRTECGVGVALLLAASLAQATTQPDFLETANDAFAHGKFPEAIRSYESILAQEGFSAPVLFNLADAQRRAGELGQAILNYERAAWLSPNDADITTNLSSTRQQAGLLMERASMVQAAA